MYKININFADGTHTITHTNIVTALHAYAKCIEEVYGFDDTVFSITYSDIDGVKLVFKPE
jgi:hypothetical protein